jgi:hypothetical protein
VEQNNECDNEKNDVNYFCVNGDSGCDQMYMKKNKSKKGKHHVPGDTNSGCDTVNEDVQICEVLPKNLNEYAEYTKQKGKKRKKKGEDNVSCLSDEQHLAKKSQCEELLEGVQCALAEESKRRHGKNGNDVDVKLDVISSCVTRGSECANTGSGSDSLEAGVVSSIATGCHAETVQRNESLVTEDTNTKRRRKRTRRHRKSCASEHSKTTESSQASVTNPKRETFIQSVAAPRTHIRFSDWDGDVSTENEVNDPFETYNVTSQMEFKPACTSPVNVEVSDLQSSVMCSNVDVASSELNGKEDRKLNSLSSHEENSTKWDMQAVDSLQSSSNNCNFAKLLTFKNSSTPHVYQRKKKFETADTTVNGTTPGTSSNTDLGNTGEIKLNKTSSMDMENRGQTEIADKKIDFSLYPFLKDMPKKGDIVAFKVGLAYNICSIMFLCLWCSD